MASYRAVGSLAETVLLEDRMYFFDRGNPVCRLESCLPPSSHDGHPTASWKEVEPLTVLEILTTGNEVGGRRVVTFEELRALLDKSLGADDIWHQDFLRNLILQPKLTDSSTIAITLAEEVLRKLETEYNTTHVFYGSSITLRPCEIRDKIQTPVIGKGDGSSTAFLSPLPGPYFLSLTDGRLMPAYRVYEDTNETFIQSTYCPNRGKSLPVPIHTGSLHHISVAIPSRLSSCTPTPERPLAGLRFSVKDIFYVPGLAPPSLGSRAWVSMRHDHCQNRQQGQAAGNNESDGIVELLQKKGAVFVGRNRLSEFSLAGPYHWQNTDYLLSVNPRADGLQTPSDSSGGSASAVASYDWLDFAIGTDTGGSIRLPADANGVYGGRPTTGAINASSMQSLAKSLDTIGVLARDPVIYCKVFHALLEYSTAPTNTFSSQALVWRLKIIVNKDQNAVAEEASVGNPPASSATEIFEFFIRKLETSLGVRREYVVLESLWEQKKQNFGNPRTHSASGELLGDLGDEFGDLYRQIVYWESYRDLGSPFIKAYSLMNDGRLPLINNNAKAAWKTVETGAVSESTYTDALAKKDKLKSWVSRYLTEEQDGTSTLLVSCGSSQGEDLRDTQSDERYFAPSQPSRVLPYGHLTTLADLPDHHLPIGQFEGWSSVTEHTEIYPLTASLAVANGRDRLLLEVIEHLYRDGVLEKVKTGRTAF